MCKYCDEIIAAETREKAMASGAGNYWNSDPGSLDVVTSVERERLHEHSVAVSEGRYLENCDCPYCTWKMKVTIIKDEADGRRGDRIQRERCEHGVSLWQWCEPCHPLTPGWQYRPLIEIRPSEVLMGVGDIFDCSEMD